MSEEPGTITHGEAGDLLLGIGGERFVLASDEIRQLLFTGRVVPVTEARRVRRDDGSEAVEVAIVGHAAINRAGRAVLFHTTAGHFIIPLVSLQRVARGVRRAGFGCWIVGEFVVGRVWVGPGQSISHNNVRLLLAHCCCGVDEHSEN